MEVIDNRNASANNQEAYHGGDMLEHAAPVGVRPAWQTDLDELDLNAITSWPAVQRVLQARIEQARSAWLVEHHDDHGFLSSNGGLRSLAPRQDAQRIFEHGLLTFGGASIAFVDLADEIQALVWRSYVEHGHVDSWPADVKARIAGAPRKTTHADRLGRRRQLLRAEAAQTAAAAIKTHGADPIAWPVEALDELARAKARVVALDDLADAAQARDTMWSRGKSI